MSIGDHQGRPFHSPALEILEKRAPAVLRFVEHRLHGQDFTISRLIDAAGDHHGHGNNPALDADLLVESIDPDDRVLLLQRPGAKRFHLGVQFPVEFGDLGGRDVLDAHRLGQPLDFPGRDAIDERFLNNGDQGLFGSTSFRDEKRDVAAFSNLGDQKIDCSQAGIDSPDPSPGKIGRSFF